MNDRKNKLFNLNFYNEKINNSCMIETNINNDCEDSDKSLSLEDNPTCIPHLIEKINCLKSKINEKNEEIVDDKNDIINNNRKNSKIIGDESLDSKTIFIEKKYICGRKRIGDKYDNNEHNKFSEDNARRKVKRIVFTHLLKYINKQIKIKYNGKIGKGILKKELYILQIPV